MYARLRCGGNLPLPRPGVDRPLRVNCHPLSCAPDNQVRCVFGSAPYQKRASTVRNMRAVRKTGSCGTRRIFGSIRCKKTGFYGTEEIFGTGNALLRYAMHLQRPAEQPTPQTVDSPCRTGRIFSARNGPRSDVCRHKKRVTSKSIKTF